jgi:hypothetical protein
MNALRKSRVVAGVVIVLVFGAGVVVGFFLQGTMPHHGFAGLAIVGPPPGPPRELKGSMLAQLDKDLKLTPEQHARIDSVLTRSQTDIRALMTETRPRFEAISSRTRSEIQAVLTPVQQQEFTVLTRQIEERRARRRGP